MSAWQIGAAYAAVAVSMLGAFFGLWMNIRTQRNQRDTDKAKDTTAVIALGVEQLIDQYQEANKELVQDVHECKSECQALKTELVRLREEFDKVVREKELWDVERDNLHAELIGYKRKAGEL